MADERQRTDTELVPEDDAIIGRVFRWSVVVIAGVAAIVAVVVWLSRGEKPVERAIVKEAVAVPDRVTVRSEMPGVRFADVTGESGIDFVHANGARGRKLLPETMGGGVAVIDYDGDGAPDLLFVNGRPWPGTAGEERDSVQRLYRNDGRGKFRDVTERAGVDLSLYGMGAAVADYDGDGDDDVFLAAVGPNVLLQNDSGRFVDVTSRAGVSGGADEWSSSAGFLDYDNDGDLDLFVCNYVRWSPAIDVELSFTLNGTDRAYGPPTSYEGTYPYLYRNEGDGTFRDVSADAGVQVDNPVTGLPMAKALAVTFVDLDRDRHLDILVANDTVQNFLFHNRGDGTFEEIGAVAGVGFDGAGNATGAMGIDAAHYRNDDELGVAIGNFANEMTSLYVSQTDPLRFTDESIGEGIGGPSRLFLSFGLFFFDYDLDGRVDMLQANGHLEDEIHEVQASQSYRQQAQLFWNLGPESRSCFAEVSAGRAGDLSRPIVGRGAAYADFDADGDLDVVLTQTGGAPMLLRNEQQTGHHWLRVRLEGDPPNRDAIGAWVELQAEGTLQRRQVMPTRSYLSQVEKVVTFGLGTAGEIDTLRVIWPNGTVQETDDPQPDRVLVVRASR